MVGMSATVRMSAHRDMVIRKKKEEEKGVHAATYGELIGLKRPSFSLEEAPQGQEIGSECVQKPAYWVFAARNTASPLLPNAYITHTHGRRKSGFFITIRSCVYEGEKAPTAPAEKTHLECKSFFFFWARMANHIPPIAGLSSSSLHRRRGHVHESDTISIVILLDPPLLSATASIL